MSAPTGGRQANEIELHEHEIKASLYDILLGRERTLPMTEVIHQIIRLVRSFNLLMAHPDTEREQM